MKRKRRASRPVTKKESPVPYMKANFPWAYEQFTGATSWMHREFLRFINNFMDDMRSMRALFNYAYLLLYMFLCVWAAIYYAKTSLNTAIVTTGGIVGTIFSAYVWSTTKEKEMGQLPISPISKPQPTSGSDDEENG